MTNWAFLAGSLLVLILIRSCYAGLLLLVTSTRGEVSRLGRKHFSGGSWTIEAFFAFTSATGVFGSFLTKRPSQAWLRCLRICAIYYRRIDSAETIAGGEAKIRSKVRLHCGVAHICGSRNGTVRTCWAKLSWIGAAFILTCIAWSTLIWFNLL